MERRGAWIGAVLCGVACAVAFQAATRVGGSWGRSFSPDVGLRLQTEALLAGRLALQSHPFGAFHDAAWGRGGMHQNWSVGVPLLRLPGEVAARLAGEVGFPDRLVFLGLLAAVAAVLFRALLPRGALRAGAGAAGAGAAGAGAAGAGAAGAATAFLILFPTLAVLVSARFSVYEEVEAYGCLWALLLLGLLLRLRAEPAVGGLLLLAAACAFAPLVRVTGAFAGAASFALAAAVAWRAHLPARWIAAAAGIALLGPLSLLALNELRFGAPLEFGYPLVLGAPSANVVSRFANPYAGEPLASALRELLAFAFPPQPPGDPYAEFPGMGAAYRFRELYFAPFAPGTAPALALAAALWLAQAALALRRGRLFPSTPHGLVAAWGALAGLPFLAFYLRTPALTSRYVAELYPAVAALLLAAGLLARRAAAERHPALGHAVGVGLIAAAALSFQARQTSFPYDFRDAVRADQIATLLARTGARPRPLPAALACGEWPRHAFAIPNNLYGWNADCTFAPGMHAVLPESPCVELRVALPAGTGAAEAGRLLGGIRVLSDRARLERRWQVRSGARFRLGFCAAAPPVWRLAGLQLVSLGQPRGSPLRLEAIAAAAAPEAGEPAPYSADRDAAGTTGM